MIAALNSNFRTRGPCFGGVLFVVDIRGAEVKLADHKGGEGDEEEEDEGVVGFKQVWTTHKDAIYAFSWLFLGFVFAYPGHDT